MTAHSSSDIKNHGFIGFFLLGALLLFLFFTALCCGPVDIPPAEIWRSLTARCSDPVSSAIILHSRLPMACTAAFAGASLSAAGLILQTVFRNPLAGPSLLGVSSGASLGVAVVMMWSASGAVLTYSTLGWLSAMLGAVAGAMGVIMLLLLFSATVRNGVMLLIAGVLLSYLASSVISLLSYVAPADSLKSFTVWGMGSFSAVTSGRLPLFMAFTAVLCVASAGCVKPLNAFLLGERYASTMGYSVRLTRSLLLIVSGLLTAVVTAYCGPVGFVGLIVPHLVRMLFRTSNHAMVLPGSLLAGAVVALLCVVLANGTLSDNILPINVVTPLLGVPVIGYIILRGNRLPYFK